MMVTRKYPGMRSNLQKTSKVSENKLAWVKLSNVTISFFRQGGEFFEGLPEGSPQVEQYREFTEGDGDQIVLTVDTHKSLVSIPLSELTAGELRVLGNFMNTAINQALPVAEARDRISQEVLNDYDDDSNTRVYRGVPELLVRKGKGGEYNQGVWERLASPDVVVKRPGLPQQLRSYSGEMAEGDEA